MEFKGRIKTKVDAGPDEIDYERDLFRFRRILFHGPYKMKAANYEYPFSFQFPEQWDAPCEDFRGDAQFPVVPQPLPPTCEQEDQTEGDCSIGYHIRAWVPRTLADWEYTYPINFSPYRTELSPAPLLKMANYNQGLQRRYRLTEEGTLRPLTIGEALKETFHHNPYNYTINFSVSAISPTAIVLDMPYKIEFIVGTSDAQTEHCQPKFRLEHCHLSVKSITAIRAPGAVFNISGVLEDHIRLCNGPSRVPLAINNTVEINGMIPQLLPRIPPSFKSWTVHRTYDHELKGEISCLGENFAFKIKWSNIRLYPARTIDSIGNPDTMDRTRGDTTNCQV